MPPTHYRSQSGLATRITEMHTAHLANAITKLSRTGGDRDMLNALKAESNRRGDVAPEVSAVDSARVNGAEAYRKVFGA